MKTETAKALHEMMTVAARELLGYEGPITVTVLCKGTEPKYCNDCGHCWMCSEDYLLEPEPVEEFFYAQTVA